MKAIIVDPDAEARSTIRGVASSLDIEVSEANSGEEAIRRCSETRPDIIVLASHPGNLDLPGLLAAMRGSPRPGRRILSLILWEADNVASRLHSLEQGADDTIVKPLDEAELDRVLRVFVKVLELDAEVTQKTKEIDDLINTDCISGAFGRGFIQKQANLEWNRSERYGEALSVMLAEIPTLPSIRKDQGFAPTEDCLREMVKRMRDCMRRCDLIARTALAQFLVLMPNTSNVGAYFAAEKVRKVVSTEPFTKGSISLDLAIGLATFQDGNFEEPNRLIEAAQAALKSARDRGPGSIHSYGDPPRTS